MRIPVIAGNWKMHKTVAEAVATVTELKRRLAGVTGVKVVVCPPFLAIKAVADALGGTAIGVGAQDCFWESFGAFTGEVSPEMIKEAGATYVIIGHSERRQYFHETNETVNKKVKKALAAGLTPIVCVGETLAEREAGQTERVVNDHVTKGLAGLNAHEVRRCIIAYEPVWAIGTGKTATPQQAQEVHAFIRQRLAQLWDSATAATVIIQYGGSVKPENIKELMAEPDIDGALVGGASLEAASFEKIVKYNGPMT
ncbi:MAG: triose-phosphate isomerase [bacterium]|nr:triose-phosphate isomerase [bacterium]